MEQKPYVTSWYWQGSRSAESLTIPTTGIFKKGSWTTELTYIPISPRNPGQAKTLWRVKIDTNNYYSLTVESTGAIKLTVCRNGTKYSISTANNYINPGQTYSIMAAGNGTKIRLCINGGQIGGDVSYTEPSGNLIGIMSLGCCVDGSTYTSQADGLFDDVRFSNTAHTANDHQTAFNNNQPLPIDSDTTFKDEFDGNLQGLASGQGTTGIESYWNYVGLDLGGGWTASINTYNSNLVLHKTLFTIPGRGLPLQESITYNSTAKGAGWQLACDAVGRQNTYVYENFKPKQYYDMNNNITNFSYDPVDGTLTQITDPSGRVMSYYFNSSSRLISGIEDPNNLGYQFCYSNNLLSKIYDPDRKQFLFTYDANNRLKTFTDPLGRITTFTLDPDGKVLSYNDARSTQSNPYTTSFTQTTQGSNIITTMTDPGGHSVVCTHDQNTGNLIQYQDKNQNIWTYQWLNNDLIRIMDPNTPTQHKDYTKKYEYINGNVTKIITSTDEYCEENHDIIETMQYDDKNQLLQDRVDFSYDIFKYVSYKYSNKGDLISTYDPKVFESNGKLYDNYGNVVESSPFLSNTSNLLRNGSMELWNGANPTNWAHSTDGNSTISSEGFNSHGNHALKISNTGAYTSDIFSQTLNPYQSAITSKFTFKADVKIQNLTSENNNSGAMIQLEYRTSADEPKTEVWYLSGQNGTYPIEITSTQYVKAGDNSVKVSIGLVNATGTVWFDGVQLEDAWQSGTNISSDFNSVENSSFEKGAYLPDDWSYTGPAPSRTTQAHWGGYSSVTQTLSTQGTATIYQNVPVYPLEPLTFSGMARTNNVAGTGAYFQVDFYNQSGQLIQQDPPARTGSLTGTQEGSANFTRLTCIADAPTNAYYAKVQAILDGTGTVYYDCLKLVPRKSEKYSYNSGKNYITNSTNALKNNTFFTYDENVGNMLSGF